MNLPKHSVQNTSSVGLSVCQSVCVLMRVCGKNQGARKTNWRKPDDVREVKKAPWMTMDDEMNAKMKSDRLGRETPHCFIRCGVWSLRHWIDLGELSLPLEVCQNTAAPRVTPQKMETHRSKGSLPHLHHQKLPVTPLVVAVHDRPVLNQLHWYVRAAASRWCLSSAETVIHAEPTAHCIPTLATPDQQVQHCVARLAASLGLGNRDNHTSNS